MIISIPDSWVKTAMPQPTTSAGRTQGLRNPRQPRVVCCSSAATASWISSSSGPTSTPSARTRSNAPRAPSTSPFLTSQRGLSGNRSIMNSMRAAGIAAAPTATRQLTTSVAPTIVEMTMPTPMAIWKNRTSRPRNFVGLSSAT